MAKRVPNPAFRTFSVTLEGVPAGLDEEMVKKLIEGAVKDMGKVAITTTPLRKPVLRNRNVRKARTFPCTYTEGALVGCGRAFASEKNRDKHMDHVSGIWADSRRFPHYCLDAIVTADLRDDR